MGHTEIFFLNVLLDSMEKLHNNNNNYNNTDNNKSSSKMRPERQKQVAFKPSANRHFIQLSSVQSLDRLGRRGT